MSANDMRRLIAHEAARLIAEDGGLDYGAAKRKAARQLGVPESHTLPDNRQIEEALRTYQSLYQSDEQQAELHKLREVALEYLLALESFDPWLTGSVLKGTANRHSDINLQLFTDSEKELEFFLIDRKLSYVFGEVRIGQQNYPSFLINDVRGALTLTVLPPFAQRQLKRTQPDGSPQRIRAAQLATLLGKNA
jgi:hypothetical protein